MRKSPDSVDTSSLQQIQPTVKPDVASRLKQYCDGVKTINVPKNVSHEVKQQLRKYKSVRSGTHFQCFIADAMLIGCRFSSVPQLHLLQSPGGYRKQLTFDEEPSVRAVPLRKNDSGCTQVIYAQDEGGDEYSRYHLLDTRTGTSTSMAAEDDGKLKNSASPCLSQDGGLLAYATTRRNGKDKDIYFVDLRGRETLERVLADSQLLMRNLPNAPMCSPIGWSASGDSLLVSIWFSASNTRIAMVNLNQGLVSHGQSGMRLLEIHSGLAPIDTAKEYSRP